MKISIPHKWRKLDSEKRLEIPEKIFSINKKEIEKIRNIEDSEKRLIAAAKLQYDLFGDIHNDLTTWIAGYLSEVIIRNKFISAKNLRKIVIKEDNKIDSWEDIKRNIRIPNEMNNSLSEEIGIHIGDGNLYVGKVKNKNWFNYRYGIYGHLIDDYIYHTKHISNLLDKLYNYRGSIIIQKEKNSIGTIIRSKSIVNFKNKILKLPIGEKKSITIPKAILKHKEFIKKCIIGIIDTDFTFSNNLRLIGKMHSINLMKQIHNSLSWLNIKHSVTEKKDHHIIRIDKEDSKKIIEEWHINNEKHISKYNLWNEYHLYLPFTTTPERLAVLTGKIDIENLIKISKKRRNMIR